MSHIEFHGIKLALVQFLHCHNVASVAFSNVVGNFLELLFFFLHFFLGAGLGDDYP